MKYAIKYEDGSWWGKEPIAVAQKGMTAFSMKRWLFDTRAEAEAQQERSVVVPSSGSRIVRILSHGEAKLKFAAWVLREMGGEMRDRSDSDTLRREADVLWPVKS
jgi:hypothetical protein